MSQHRRIFRLFTGSLCGLLLGALCGAVLVPVLTYDWLFTTSMTNIRKISAPVFMVLGVWVGIVFGDLFFMSKTQGEDTSSTNIARRIRWSVILGSVALLGTIALFGFEPFGVVQLLNSVLPKGSPHFASYWLVLVNSLCASLLAIMLGMDSARRVNIGNRRVAIIGGTLGILSFCAIGFWLSGIGRFLLFWDI
jgi:hypothetical protein